MFFPLEIQQAAAKIIKEIQELAQSSRDARIIIKHAKRTSERVYIRKENHDGWHFIHLSMSGTKEEIYIPIDTRRSRQRTWECSCTSKDTCRHKAAVAFAIQQSCIKEISEMNQEDIHTLFFVKIRDVGLSIYEHFPKKRLLFFIEESLLWGGAIHAYKDWYYSEAYDQELCARIRLDGWQKILSLLTSPSFTTYIKPKEGPLCFGDSNPIYNRSTHTIDCSKQTKRALKKLGHSSLIECAMDEDSFSKPSVVSEIEKLGLSTKCHIRLSRWSNGQSISEQLSGCWNEHLFNRVEELELSIRSANCLQNAGIDYIYQLVQKTEGDMLRTKNFGRKSLSEIKALLKERELGLGMKLHNFPEHKAR